MRIALTTERYLIISKDDMKLILLGYQNVNDIVFLYFTTLRSYTELIHCILPRNFITLDGMLAPVAMTILKDLGIV